MFCHIILKISVNDALRGRILRDINTGSSSTVNKYPMKHYYKKVRESLTSFSQASTTSTASFNMKHYTHFHPLIFLVILILIIIIQIKLNYRCLQKNLETFFHRYLLLYKIFFELFYSVADSSRRVLYNSIISYSFDRLIEIWKRKEITHLYIQRVVYLSRVYP